MCYFVGLITPASIAKTLCVGWCVGVDVALFSRFIKSWFSWKRPAAPGFVAYLTLAMATKEDSGDAPITTATSQFVGNRRARRKDAKAVAKALEREKRSRNYVTVAGAPSVQMDEWQRKYNGLVLAYNSCMAHPRDDREGCQRVCNLATELIESARAIESGMLGAEVDISHLIFVYLFRCRLRFALEDYQGAIEDASDGLTTYYKLGESFREKYDEKGIEAEALFTRGQSLTRLAGVAGSGVGLTNDDAIEQLGRAIADLKACCSAIRLTGSNFCHEVTVGQATDQLLEAMTILKVKKGAARPHYTETERTKVQKELGLGIYKDQIYRCLSCNEAPSKTVKLSLCSRCESVWLCSRECMIDAWKNKGHKQVCKDIGIEAEERSQMLLLLDSLKADIDAGVARQGYINMANLKDDEPWALVRDGTTGRLFDSVSDENFYFVPSETALIEEIRRQRKLID
jgi:hypothetical protein